MEIHLFPVGDDEVLFVVLMRRPLSFCVSLLFNALNQTFKVQPVFILHVD